MPAGNGHGVSRVLMTADAVGGVWSYAIDLATVLRQHHVDVTMAVLGPPPSERQIAAASRVATVLIHDGRLEWMDDPWTDVQAAGEWLLDIEDRIHPDVVHLNGYCHGALPWRAPVLVVAHSCVRSWWRAVHGGDAPPAFDRYRDQVARGLAHARIVICPTGAMLSALEREYETVPRARLIPNGRAHGRPAAAPERKEPLVFAAGRIWDEAKNIDSLCAIAESLSWPVYVAGDTISPAGRAAAAGYVRHLGRLDAEEVAQWYQRAAIYALPARYEPFGLSVLEAAMAGCALVLGDISSLRENWTGAAVFVSPDNRRALARAIQRLIEDAGERARFAARAAAQAKQFTLEGMAAGYLSVYRDIVGGAATVKPRAASRTTSSN